MPGVVQVSQRIKWNNMKQIFERSPLGATANMPVSSPSNILVSSQIGRSDLASTLFGNQIFRR